MICKYCSHETPDSSVYCCQCGERLARKRAEKKAAGPKYPKYRVLTDGSLLGQLMVDGRRETIKAKDETEYRAKIDAYRTHILEMKEHPERRSMQTVLRAYIDKNDGVLSPATIRVKGAIVRDKNGKLVEKETNKNKSSTRTVPVMIPRLLEILPAGEGHLVTIPPPRSRRASRAPAKRLASRSAPRTTCAGRSPRWAIICAGPSARSWPWAAGTA